MAINWLDWSLQVKGIVKNNVWFFCLVFFTTFLLSVYSIVVVMMLGLCPSADEERDAQ